MKKTDKQYAEEFLAIAQHIHVTIKRLLEAGNYPLAMIRLEQCQSYAISFGQQFESVEGADSVIIMLLEEYCEFVYQIYEKLRYLLPVNPNSIHNSLSKRLIHIGDRIRNNNQKRKV